MIGDDALAARMSNIEGSGVRRMFDLIRTMKDPINLSIGQAHYDTPQEVKDAAIAAIQEGRNRYTVTEGNADLNDAISERLATRWGGRPEAVMVTSGVSGGLLLSHFATIDPGDEVLLPDPYFVMYRNVLELVGGKAKYYDLYPKGDRRAWHPDLAQLESQIGPRTKAILINSPGNPTGGVFDAAELRGIVEIASRHGLWVLADEIYSHFCYDEPMASMARHFDDYERVIVLGGFSKTYGVPGWRLGWVAGATQVLESMKLLQQYTFVCAPSPLQRGAFAAFELDMGPRLDEYRAKRDRVYEGLSGLYNLVPSEGSFYSFVEYPAGIEEGAFIERCLERKLLVVPGSAFSARATHFRLSFAADDEMLDKGLAILREIAEG